MGVKRGLTLREQHKPIAFENRVLRRTAGPMKWNVTGNWRSVHNEELHNFYSMLIIIRMVKARRMGWEEHVACIT
jgi:hypothetical protein